MDWVPTGYVKDSVSAVLEGYEEPYKYTGQVNKSNHAHGYGKLHFYHKSMIGIFVNGIPSLCFTKYNYNDNLRSIFSYNEDGLLHGTCIHYYLHNKVYTALSYKEGHIRRFYMDDNNIYKVIEDIMETARFRKICDRDWDIPMDPELTTKGIFLNGNCNANGNGNANDIDPLS